MLVSDRDLVVRFYDLFSETKFFKKYCTDSTVDTTEVLFSIDLKHPIFICLYFRLSTEGIIELFFNEDKIIYFGDGESDIITSTLLGGFYSIRLNLVGVDEHNSSVFQQILDDLNNNYSKFFKIFYKFYRISNRRHIKFNNESHANVYYNISTDKMYYDLNYVKYLNY